MGGHPPSLCLADTPPTFTDFLWHPQTTPVAPIAVSVLFSRALPGSGAARGRTLLAALIRMVIPAAAQGTLRINLLLLAVI